MSLIIIIIALAVFNAGCSIQNRMEQEAERLLDRAYRMQRYAREQRDAEWALKARRVARRAARLFLKVGKTASARAAMRVAFEARKAFMQY